MIMLAARVSRAWWTLWRPFWPWIPLVLAARVQLAIILLAMLPLVIREDPRSGSALSVVYIALGVYGAVAQLLRRFRLRRFVPWDDKGD